MDDADREKKHWSTLTDSLHWFAFSSSTYYPISLLVLLLDPIYWSCFTRTPPPHSGRSPTGPAPTGPLFTLPLHRPRLVDAPTPLTGPPLVFFLSGLPFSGPTSSIPLFTGPFLAVSPSVHPPPPSMIPLLPRPPPLACLTFTGWTLPPHSVVSPYCSPFTDPLFTGPLYLSLSPHPHWTFLQWPPSLLPPLLAFPLLISLYCSLFTSP